MHAANIAAGSAPIQAADSTRIHVKARSTGLAPSTNISQKRSPVIAKPFLQTIWILNKLTTITDRASTPRGRSVAFTPGVMPAMRRAGEQHTFTSRLSLALLNKERRGCGPGAKRDTRVKGSNRKELEPWDLAQGRLEELAMLTGHGTSHAGEALVGAPHSVATGSAQASKMPSH